MTIPLVLLPGLMCDAGLWQRMRPELEAMGPLIFGDLSLGHSVEEMAATVLSGCPKHFILVGFSMGGFVAREIARRAPERVRGLVLIATSSAADDTQQTEIKKTVAARLQQASGPFHGLGQRAIKLSLSVAHESDTQLKRQILEMSQRLGRDAWIRQLLMTRNGDAHLLGDIHCPTLVVAAADDRMRTLAESQQLADAIPQASLVIIADSGHMLPLEQPTRLGTCLHNWLSTPNLR